MYLHLYALNERRIRHFLGEVREIAGGSKARLWPLLYRKVAAFHPRPLLGSSGGATRPYTEVSYHTSPALAWNDFSPDEVPELQDPRLAWILRLMVLETSDHLLVGRDARFNAVFCIWLPDQKVIRGAEEQAAFELYRDRLFYSREAVPEDLFFLESEGHRSYLPPDQVACFASREREVGLLSKLAERMKKDEYGALVAQELRRMQKFFELVEVEGGAICYSEQAS